MLRLRPDPPRVAARADLDAVLLNVSSAERRLAAYEAAFPWERPGPRRSRARRRLRRLLRCAIRFEREVNLMVWQQEHTAWPRKATKKGRA